MMVPRKPLRFLSQEEMETIHRNALRILDEIGMKIDHDDALDYLRSSGCRVDHERKTAKFPADVVQKYVDKMRSDFARREYPEMMSVRYSHVRFKKEPFGIHSDFTVNAGGYCVFVHDMDGVHRPATLQDTRDALRIVAQLDQITHTGIPVAAQDVPLGVRPVRMVAELVKATDKLGGIEAFSPFDIEYICRIGEVVRGSAEELRRRPILVGYAEAKTPLTIDHNMCEVLIEYVKRGMPQSLDTMPNAGATAPIHPSAALALGVAETLAGLVLAYSVDGDACVTVDLTPSFCDMSTGIFKYAGAERASLLGARIQMVSEFYGCPSGVHGGKTDACAFDVRCGLEKGVSMLFPVLCGAVGFGTVGHIENAVTFSPVQAVMDNEMVRYIRRAISGFDVTDETINLDLIKKVGIGGNYLEEPDTALQFRDLLNLSPLFTVAPWGKGRAIDPTRDWEHMARRKVAELLAKEVECPLTREQVKDIDAIVGEASAKVDHGRT